MRMAVGLPVMKPTYEEACQVELPYPCGSIQARGFYHHERVSWKRTTTVAKVEKPVLSKTHVGHGQGHSQGATGRSQRTFVVTADMQQDIYHLHDIRHRNYVDVALVPDYSTSVMLNRLFRNIKENQNLDALEESDDEDEFENDRLDKFLRTDIQELSMVCQFHPKFKKWVPVSVVQVQKRGGHNI